MVHPPPRQPFYLPQRPSKPYRPPIDCTTKANRQRTDLLYKAILQVAGWRASKTDLHKAQTLQPAFVVCRFLYHFFFWDHHSINHHSKLCGCWKASYNIYGKVKPGLCVCVIYCSLFLNVKDSRILLLCNLNLCTNSTSYLQLSLFPTAGKMSLAGYFPLTVQNVLFCMVSWP